MTHLIEFVHLKELLNDLDLDGDQTSPIRLTHIQHRRQGQPGIGIYHFTFSITVRAINQAGHLLIWTYITGRHTSMHQNKQDRAEYDQQWQKLTQATTDIRNWLKSVCANDNRIRPGLIQLPQPQNEPLSGHWPIDTEESND